MDSLTLPFLGRHATEEEATQDLGSTAPWAIGLGRFVTGDKKYGGRLRYGGERHVLLFGPNGSGKGMGLLVPNLLQMTGRSIVAIDPKGELAAITAPHRRSRDVGEVVIINPFGVIADRRGYEDLESQGYNPLLALDPRSPSFNAEASWLAEALVMVEGNDPHWSRAARKLIAALIMHVVLLADKAKRTPNAPPVVPTLGMVRALLTEPFEQPSAEHPHGRGIPRIAREMMAWGLPALRQKAGQFQRWDREIASIVSTADTQTEAFDDAEIAADLEKPGIDFRELKKRPITVYVILPPDMMERHARWLRLILSSALRGVMRLREEGEQRVLFMIDEFAALGHLPIIETTWALVRGYGIQLWPVLQDLNQLKSLYKDRWETFVGMAGVTAAYGPNDLTTADWMSRRAGDTTLVMENFSENVAPSGRTQNISHQPTRVPYLPSHELFDTPRGYLHIWLANMASTVSAYAPMWVDIGECVKRGRENPYSPRT